jgi:beta-galactosidase
MKVGASYYPELSSPKTWITDLTVARDLGLRAVRCGEFAWGRFSPEPGRWEDGWALEFLEIARDLDIDVFWCTPTATPPPYLFDRWPELAAVNQDEARMPVGVRRQYCPSHEGYLDLSEEVAGKLARSLAAHPSIVGWQVDNEIAGDGFTCWCPRCGKAFQKWLEKEYGSLECLNQKWQTALWSQRYTQWSQIPIPQRAFTISHTPALKFAWRQFRSSNWLAFYRRQAEALRRAGVPQPVTTNFYNLEWDIPFDRWQWRSHLDAIGISHYVEEEIGSRFELALLRGWGEKALWVLEQKAGQQNAQNLYPESLDRLETHLQRCAEGGADYAIYWHLRQHQAGCEMEHGAVLRHDGKPTRVAMAIQRAIPKIASLAAEPLDTSCALVFDFPHQWAQENRPQPGTAWDYRKTVEQDWYGALRKLRPGAVVSSLPDALKKAKVVYAPHYQMADESIGEAIHDFTSRGGIFVTTADFGRLDAWNNVRPQKPLAAFSLFGSVPDGELLHLKADFSVDGSIGTAELRGRFFWFVPSESKDDIHLRDGDFSGPALLEFKVKAGRIVILLSAFDRESLASLLSLKTSP